MEEINYRPNLVARSLASKSRTKIIGLILPSTDKQLFHNPFFIQVLTAVSIYAQEKGYYVIHANAREQEKELSILKDLEQSQWVDGIILSAARESEESVAYLNAVGKPYVLIGRTVGSPPKAWVDNDNVTATYNATKRMLEKGYRRITFIGGSIEFRVNKDRLEGYKKAMAEAKIPMNDRMIFLRDDTEENGAAGMAYFLADGTPDAVVTTDDLIAFGASQTGYEATGRFIPVVGFNNTAISKYRNPAFSSVEIYADLLGQHAVKMLIDQLETSTEGLTSDHCIVDTELVER